MMFSKQKIWEILLFTLCLFLLPVPGYSLVALFQDEFNQSAGNLAEPGQGNNAGPGWRWASPGWRATTGFVLDPVTTPTYDGQGHLLLPMVTNCRGANCEGNGTANTHNQFLDTPCILIQGHVYSLIFVFSKPPQGTSGDELMGFIGDLNWTAGDRLRVLYFHTPNTIWLFQDVNSAPTEVQFGEFQEDAMQSFMMRINEAGTISVFYNNGVLKDPNSPLWEERVSTDPSSPLMQFNGYGSNRVGFDHNYFPPRDPAVLTIDYVGLFDMNASVTPTPLPVTPTPTPKPPIVDPTPTAHNALFVVDTGALDSAGDDAIRLRLQQLGFGVWTRDDTAVIAADANGKEVIVISSSVGSGNLNEDPSDANSPSKFLNTTVPVISWEAGTWDNLKMTVTAGLPDAGADLSTQLAITNASHPLAGGLTGTVTVFNVADALRWGNPSSAATGAIRVASHGTGGDATRSAIFAYDTGGMMEGLAAPGKRIGYFFGDGAGGTGNSTLTAQGVALFDAAIQWSTGVAPGPTPTATPVATGTPNAIGELFSIYQ